MARFYNDEVSDFRMTKKYHHISLLVEFRIMTFLYLYLQNEEIALLSVITGGKVAFRMIEYHYHHSGS